MAASLAFDDGKVVGIPAPRHVGMHGPRAGRRPAVADAPRRGGVDGGVALLERLGATQRFAPGSIVVFEGDDVEDCFKVVSGAVRLCKITLDGRRLVLDFRVPGEFLGVPGLDVHAYTAEAIGEVTLRRYPRRRLEALVDTHPALAKYLLAVAARELRSAQEQMLLLGRRSAHEKVASFLARMAALAGGGRQEPGAAFDLPMSRHDIADYLGLTVETVSRAFTALRRAGVIALPRSNRVVLLRPAALGELAEGGPEERLAG